MPAGTRLASPSPTPIRPAKKVGKDPASPVDPVGQASQRNTAQAIEDDEAGAAQQAELAVAQSQVVLDRRACDIHQRSVKERDGVAAEHQQNDIPGIEFGETGSCQTRIADPGIRRKPTESWID